jgi:nucleoside-triphosphatase
MTEHLLLTGKPGVGKTTLIETIVADLRQNFPDLKLTGFITKEVRAHSVRIGFDLLTLDGKKGILARTSFKDKKHRNRVGKYFVDLEDLESIGIPSLQKEADLIILDEIGKMELLSHAFKEALEILFNGKTFLVATIAFYDTPETIKMKKAKRTRLIEVTHQNREHLPKRLIHQIKSLVKD